MSKSFQEVFQGLNFSEDEKNVFLESTIERLSVNKKKTYFRVYLSAHHLIEKKYIIALENRIKSQIFSNENTIVKVYEKFDLSSLYNAKYLWEQYKDSIFYELKSINMLDYQILSDAKIEFIDERKMLIRIEETIIAEERAAKLIEYLDKVFSERCGIDLEIRVEYIRGNFEKEKEISKYEMDMQISRIIDSKAEHLNQKEASVNKAKIDTNDVLKKRHSLKDKGKQIKKQNSSVIFGYDFDESEFSDINSIEGENVEVIIRGEIISLDERELKNSKYLITFAITDFTDTIKAKIFLKQEMYEEIIPVLKKGEFVFVKGNITFDSYDKEVMISHVKGIKKAADFRSVREDDYPQKRVELHCHTKMSEMDAVTDVKELIKRAKKWGHKALAVTDHGVVQAFTDANHAVDPSDDFKVIYGVEAYLVDDLKTVIFNNKGQTLLDDFVVFDIETTGFNAQNCNIIEIGAVKISKGKIVDNFSSFVNPHKPIPLRIEQLTQIKDEMVIDAPDISVVLKDFMEFCKGCVLVAK